MTWFPPQGAARWSCEACGRQDMTLAVEKCVQCGTPRVPPLTASQATTQVTAPDPRTRPRSEASRRRAPKTGVHARRDK